MVEAAVVEILLIDFPRYFNDQSLTVLKTARQLLYLPQDQRFITRSGERGAAVR